MKLLLVLLLAGVSLCARASVVFSHDFQSYSPGVLPESTLTKWLPRSSPNTNDNGTNILTRVGTDSADLFGQGTSNQYLRLADSSTNTALTQNVTNNTLTLGQSGIISFSFYDPSGDSPTKTWCAWSGSWQPRKKTWLRVTTRRGTNSKLSLTARCSRIG